MSLESDIRIYFGGAEVEVSISRILPQEPVATHVASDIQRFLSVMQKAHYQGKDVQFSLCLAAMVEEVDAYLDDERLGREEKAPKFLDGKSNITKLIKQRRKKDT